MVLGFGLAVGKLELCVGELLKSFWNEREGESQGGERGGREREGGKGGGK